MLDGYTILLLVFAGLLTQAFVRGIGVESDTGPDMVVAPQGVRPAPAPVAEAALDYEIGLWTCLHCNRDFHAIRYDVRFDARHGGRCPHCGQVVEPKDSELPTFYV